MNRSELTNHEKNTQELSAPTVTNSKTRPASSQVKVEIAGATHCGHVRKNNEDHFLAMRFQRSLETLCTNLGEDTLKNSFEEVGYGLLVADGMGGMAAGEVASRMALCKLVELVVNTPDWIMQLDHRKNESQVMERMTQRFRLVDEALRDEAQQETSKLGMGTTLTVAVSLGSKLLMGHIGDSRAYVLRGGSLHQLTRDHTLAQALIDAGIANPGDAATHALHHVLTAALGATSERADPQVLSFRLSHNDQILLCTDGLTEMVPAESIASILNEETSSSAAACDSLIEKALSAGGVDNVTVVLARYQFPESA